MAAAFQIPGLALLRCSQQCDLGGIVFVGREFPTRGGEECARGKRSAEEMDSGLTRDGAGEVHPPATIAAHDRCISDVGGIGEWGEAVGGIENLCLVQDRRCRTVVASTHLNIVALCTDWVTTARCNSGLFFYNPRNRSRKFSW